MLISRPPNDGEKPSLLGGKECQQKRQAKKRLQASSPRVRKPVRGGSAKKASAAKTQIKKTAAKVLAGAAAGAVRAIIGPLEEAAGRSEEAAGLNKQGGSKRGKSTGKSGGESSE